MPAGRGRADEPVPVLDGCHGLVCLRDGRGCGAEAGPAGEPRPQPAALAARPAHRAQRDPRRGRARALPARRQRGAGPAAPPLRRRAADPGGQPLRADPARRAADRPDADRRRRHRVGVLGRARLRARGHDPRVHAARLRLRDDRSRAAAGRGVRPHGTAGPAAAVSPPSRGRRGRGRPAPWCRRPAAPARVRRRPALPRPLRGRLGGAGRPGERAGGGDGDPGRPRRAAVGHRLPPAHGLHPGRPAAARPRHRAALAGRRRVLPADPRPRRRHRAGRPGAGQARGPAAPRRRAADPAVPVHRHPAGGGDVVAPDVRHRPRPPLAAGPARRRERRAADHQPGRWDPQAE